MKLKLSIAVAIAGLVYAIVKAYAPNFPISADQIQQLIIFLLGALGVVIVEERTRAALIAHGFNRFR